MMGPKAAITASMSPAEVPSRRLKTSEPWARAWSSPMARRTCEALSDFDEQAEPLATADSFHVEAEEQGLALDELDAEAGVVGQPPVAGAGQDHVIERSQQLRRSVRSRRAASRTGPFREPLPGDLGGVS